MTMDHAAARERIADLAIEPGGVETLTVSGSAADRELREHIVTCAECRAEVEAWSRVQRGLGASIPRDVHGRDPGSLLAPIAPPLELRSQILAAVRTPAATGSAGRATGAAAASPSPGAEAAREPRLPRRLHGLLPSFARGSGLAWAGLAAALVIVVVAGSVAWDQARRLEAAQAEVGALRDLVAAVDRVQSAPGHREASLVSANGAVGGSVAWSAHDFVVITSALPAPPAGQVYRCWLNDQGRGWAIGSMDFAGGTGYWVGSLDEWASWDLGPATKLRVSLEPTNGNPGVRTGAILLEAALGS